MEKANQFPKAPKGRRRYIDFLLPAKNPPEAESPKKNVGNKGEG